MYFFTYQGVQVKINLTFQSRIIPFYKSKWFWHSRHHTKQAKKRKNKDKGFTGAQGSENKKAKQSETEENASPIVKKKHSKRKLTSVKGTVEEGPKQH